MEPRTTTLARDALEEAALRFALRGDGDATELLRAASLLLSAYETESAVPIEPGEMIRDAAA